LLSLRKCFFIKFIIELVPSVKQFIEVIGTPVPTECDLIITGFVDLAYLRIKFS
jgi:hypothetical protein